jgi:LacI family transcriptional regulator
LVTILKNVIDRKENRFNMGTQKPLRYYSTLEDIARIAGVSKSTVSRALNNDLKVHPKTKLRVKKIAKSLGYSPNSLAKGLRHQRTKTIGVVIADISNPFFAAVIEGIEDEAMKNSYDIVLCSSGESYEREENILRLLLEKRVDGILITPSQKDINSIAHLKEIGFPFVLVGRYFDEFDTDYIIVDDVLGGYLATKHLLEKGHKRILFINAPLYISSAKERLKGYRKALLEKNIEFDEELIKTAPSAKMMEAYNITKEALSNNLGFTAVFAFSDFLAIGSMRAIYDKELKIPQDIALVGYDDIELASVLEIPLTTVQHSEYELGKKATKFLLNKIMGKKPHQDIKEIVEPRIVIRCST